MRRPSLALPTWLLAAFLLSIPAVALAAPPWEDGFSAASGRAILDAATKITVSPDAEVVVLFQERRETFAPGGESQHVIQKLDSHLADYDLNYLITLFHLGRYQEALDKQKRLQRSTASKGLALAATALLKTPGEAIRQVAVLVPDAEQRPEALRTAGAELMALRRYPESVALLSAAANGHKNAAAIRLLAEMLRQTKRRETMSFDERDPRQVVKAFFVAMGNNKADLLKTGPGQTCSSKRCCKPSPTTKKPCSS